MGSCTKLSEDAISSLPSSIIDSILARLPLKEAVRTSILSKQWRYKWTSIPKLVFDFLYNHIFLDNYVENIVYQVLHHHQGPISKFSLKFRTSPDIDQWILLLSCSQVQDFTLHLLDKHQITSHFFAFQNLKHLNLYRCIFKPPPEFKGFSKLITLDFQEVEYVPATFEQFISQSPLLERVRLVGCIELDAFEVQGPSIRFFTFHGVLKTICFRKSPVLAEVSLSIPIVQNRRIRSSTGFKFKYSNIPPMLEKLDLRPCILEFSGAGGVPSRYADSLNSLKVLNLSMYLDSIKEVACALSLARSSPNLHMLRVTLHAHRTEGTVVEFIRAQETPDHYLRQLRRVEIANFSGYETETELLRYLLASAAGLEEMVITPHHFTLLDDARLMDRIKQFPRASPTALVFI